MAIVAKEIPVYPGSKYLGDFVTSPPDDVSGAGVTYRSSANPDDILAFFEPALQRDGWYLTDVYDPDDEFVPKRVIAERDGWECRLLIIPEQGLEQYLISVRITR